MATVVPGQERWFLSVVPLLLFSGGSDGKAYAYNAGDTRLIPGSGRFPGEGNGNPRPSSPVSMPGEFHEQRSPAGYSPWGCKESDMTEQLTLSLSPVINIT